MREWEGAIPAMTLPQDTRRPVSPALAAVALTAGRVILNHTLQVDRERHCIDLWQSR
jgi:hypothetical protein